MAAPGHPHQKGLSRLTLPKKKQRQKTRTKGTSMQKKKEIKNKVLRLIISRHITLIVWGVPWGRKNTPSSFLWAGGSLWGGGICPREPKSKGFI